MVTTELYREIRRIVECIDGCHVTNRIPIAILAAFAVGCASTAKMGNPLEPQALMALRDAKVSAPQDLILKSEPGRTERVQYKNKVVSQTFESEAANRKMVHEKKEVLSFTSEAIAQSVTEQKIRQQVRILSKEGEADLHDFAMPDLGEVLEMVVTPKAVIQKAGDWPTNSVFYVSPLSLPPQPVEVGDTWTMQATWLSLKEMVPYQLEMVSILKRFVECGSSLCADIEVGGLVEIQGPLKKRIGFKSDWKGRILFSVSKGTVLWSRIQSEESFTFDRSDRLVRSCLEAQLAELAGPLGLGSACEGF